MTLDQNTVIPALIAEWAALDELLASLRPAQWAAPTGLPGWSVQDNVSHVIGTECTLSGQAPPPCEVDVRALPHVRNDIGAANEHWVIGLRDERPEQMLDRYREITAVRRKHLEDLSPSEFDAPSWTPVGQRTYGRFMRLRVLDCWMHEQDIRDALELPGHESGPCVDVALSEIAEALGYLVGKRAGAPEGSSVTIELTGPTHTSWHVVVDGRAALVEELPDPATATLRLSSHLFTRLYGGRISVEDGIGEIEFAGDTDFGRRIIHTLPFMI